MSSSAFVVFNLFFIAIYQNILLALIALPAFIAQEAHDQSLNVLDAASTLIVVASLVGETVADQQQWNFHLRKKAYKEFKTKSRPIADLEDGFLRSGLFKYSRHPNWFFEQTLWWGMYGYSVSASGQWMNYSVIGAVLLTSLFQGSLWITEMMSSKKYPKYAEYKKATNAFIPWFPSTLDGKKDH
eukprot:TRINITY_DN31616_c0_g1_i2.p1 TRINITY_DN31616_c0_g1~~TRINITY_DN31616_c0_g1_i2.p1  ORF type:complete len:185 (+),score=52.64 TRINITY_DN31616_c0_g1_i2:138-692(+)